MPAGRPTKYDRSMCDVVEAYLAEGYSLLAVAGKLGVDRVTVYRWGEQHKEFRNALNRGKAKTALWWEDRLRDLATGSADGANAASVIFGLKNRAPDEWREKVETEHSGKVEVANSAVDMLADMLARLERTQSG